ncbi:hypothetical protein MKW98_029351 [Papaver atlanticum]|uniref:Uncharacterized protein n=1 Tax=Papaver atlanticum TaxID=357466 RepID=A0AAD4XE79_9MAGN|nr:hypothetical protein MKW98_029351 [Papaver atlanticum]
MSGSNPYDFVEPYFTTSYFNNAYSHAIHPIPNYNRPEVYEGNDIIDVPDVRRPPGRPPANRHLSHYEKPPRRAMRFGNCCEIGHHNKQTCTKPTCYKKPPKQPKGS